VLSLRLFRDRTFTVVTLVALSMGFALFGSVTYMPLFLQVVTGSSPTGSGLQLVPMMGGMLVTSIASGQLISKTGKYKIFPVIGTIVMVVGLFLLSRMTAHTTRTQAAMFMLVLGLGMGMVMQVLVIAVQNAVDYTDLGVATSGATLFRFIGGAVGTAALGALFSARLAVATRAGLARPEAFATSTSTVFTVACGIAAIGAVLALLLPERPLRATVAARASQVGEEMGEAFAMPSSPEAIDRLLEGLRIIADRDVQRQFIQRIVERAGVAMTPLAAWLLLRIERDETTDVTALAREHSIDFDRLQAARDELLTNGFVVADATPNGYTLTASGCNALDKLIAARRVRLEELAVEWPEDRRAEVAARLRELAGEVVPPQRAA
jgi:MFS family permease/predicted transcriptional regulator